MKNVALAFMAVVAISLAAMYFTTAQPTAEAMTKEESTMMFMIFRRTQNVERKLQEMDIGFEVQEEMKFFINCPESLKAQGKCIAE